ncbi:MAG: deoxyribodipyrimidine photo-lyase [Dehalococcoidales bacterium]|nr:deoxyribodipyrimidine photo-lyase [Dehalococcoidales bacterium]
MMEEERIKVLNNKQPGKGQYVLYWMQASQRTEYNHALEYGIFRANEIKLPLLVFFGLTDTFPDANARHYRFMLEGLKEVKYSLNDRGIGMVIRHVSPEKGAVELAKNAALVVCDRGYLRIQKQWRRYVASNITCPLVQVESDVVVPVETASGKEEYSAATLRRKLVPLISRYLNEFQEETPVQDSTRIALEGMDIDDTERVLSSLNIDQSVKPVTCFSGGMQSAKEFLHLFIDTKLNRYAELRNNPNEDCQSQLSPYLHFGQISPLHVARELSLFHDENAEAFLEELVVRRELSMNYVYYNDRYDSFSGLPDWAKKTLNEHRNDSREYLYSREELERALTHDRYWNAAQREMVKTGKMHGYMRMYWGKKILEWSDNPENAFSAALYLNNRYELDGRDPNGFAGVAWCFGKHDRPWAGRPVFGNIRYMNANGLKRKFDIEKYAKKYA